MSIMTKGNYRSCDRTIRIEDLENFWCHRCLDPKERAKNDRSRLIAYLILLAFFMLIFLMGFFGWR